MADTGHEHIIPVLRYRDAQAAIGWLTKAFGFTEGQVTRDDAGTVIHAELRLGASMIMLGQHRPDGFMGGTAPDPAAAPIMLYVTVPDADAHHDRAAGAGAEITMPLTDQPYGSREYAARDLDGNVWSFGTYDPLA